MPTIWYASHANKMISTHPCTGPYTFVQYIGCGYTNVPHLAHVMNHMLHASFFLFSE